MSFPTEEIVLRLEAHEVRICRAAEMERYVNTHALLCDDDVPEPPYWMHLWPGAIALARRVAASGTDLAGRRVVELGCGLGLPAVVAAQRGAAVVASDWHREPLEFVRRSAAANRCAVSVVQMSWAAVAVQPPFDLCIGADIAYDVAAEEALVRCAAHLLGPGGAAWLADSVNTARDSLALRLGAAGFAVAVHTVREWEEGRPVWVRVIEARRPA